MALSPVRLRASMSVGSADTIAFTRSNSPALIASMKAALLEVVSGMPRFYPGCRARRLVCARRSRPRPDARRRPGSGRRSAPRSPSARSALCPPAGNLFSLLDTLVPDVIADRIDTGGLGAGSPARVGAHGSTWTQTVFRVGDVDITSRAAPARRCSCRASTSGSRVDVATGLMPIDVSAPGMAVTLTPRRPGGVVDCASLELIGAPPAFNGGSATAVAAGDHAARLVRRTPTCS